MSMPAVAAADYFDVVPLSCRKGSGSVKYEASVDFPVGGGREVMAAAKEWIGEILEVDGTMAEQDVSGMSADDFGRLLGTDRDSVAWAASSVATFSKRDGHRITPEEVFSCDEKQIKRLMWQYRGDLPMEVSSPDALYVGDVAFIDGWVIVIGPARGTSGAEYRLRYPEIEKWLIPAKGEGYLSR